MVPADDVRRAIMSCIASQHKDRYDLASCDAYGAPTRLVDGSVPSKQQQKRIAKALRAAQKQVAKEATRLRREAEAARAGGAGQREGQRGTRPRVSYDLPEGYWAGYLPASAEAMAGIGVPRLGIDVGGVIAVADERHASDGADDTVLVANSAIAEECVAAVRTLVERFGAAHTFIVSKAGAGTSARTRRWLTDQGFYERTGLLRQNVYFCPARPQKKPIADALGITHFIDDRWSVLEHLEHCEQRFMFPNERDNAVPATLVALGKVVKVDGWAGVLSSLRLPA